MKNVWEDSPTADLYCTATPKSKSTGDSGSLGPGYKAIQKSGYPIRMTPWLTAAVLLLGSHAAAAHRRDHQ